MTLPATAFIDWNRDLSPLEDELHSNAINENVKNTADAHADTDIFSSD